MDKVWHITVFEEVVSMFSQDALIRGLLCLCNSNETLRISSFAQRDLIGKQRALISSLFKLEKCQYGFTVHINFIKALL
ncbi:hypothetical protein C7460_11066 [Marinoscillum furvescens DSM 4134]|uniref:Uncharacterized protein n=1 Tax=Marinoscillum furvescens DSM 4134 TaxID=1122208 RepID=A0A3D9L323_MARFU|nr:hypothetical protein C7460_11066 [Marinoscillum furvescens DSM 4134]